jgi:hypothetical protein
MHNPAYEAYKPMLWAGTIIVLSMSLAMLFWSRKDLSEIEQVKGPITKIFAKHPDFPLRAGPKNRYIQIAGFHKAFELYLGGDSDDTMPDFQSIDKLKVGENITVYYQEPLPFTGDDSEKEKIVFFTRQIERDGQPHYIRGNSDTYLATIMLSISGLLAAFLYFHKNQ